MHSGNSNRVNIYNVALVMLFSLWFFSKCLMTRCDTSKHFLTYFSLLFCDCSWPSSFCLWAPSVCLSALSLCPPGSAAGTPPSSPSPACALWWPLQAGPADSDGDDPGKEKKKDYKNAEYAERFCKINEIYGKICLCLWVCCTRFALCWSSPCLSFSALSISKTSWVLSSNSLWVSLWSHTSTFIEQYQVIY